jgi:hypothetical protein
MDTLYFPADAVIGQAALFLKDPRALADKVRSSPTSICSDMTFNYPPLVEI